MPKYTEMKRKRKARGPFVGADYHKNPKFAQTVSAHKRRKTANGQHEKANNNHPVLASYYPRVCTLRQYLASALKDAGASKHRRRLLDNFRAASQKHDANEHPADEDDRARAEPSDCSADVVLLLDRYQVGVCDVSPEMKRLEGCQREQAFEEFTQRMSASVAGTGEKRHESTTTSMHEVNFQYQ